MVDTIRFNTTIREENLNMMMWKKGKKLRKNNRSTIFQENEEYFYTFVGSVRVAYYPSTESLVIGGRLISLYYDDKISNFDDVFSEAEQLTDFFEKANNRLNQLFVDYTIDIRKLKITRIDYCFNIITLCVSEYIRFFNYCFKKNAGQRFSNLINYTKELEKSDDSSCYLKTKGDFSNNTSRNYVINFYNKLSELVNRRNKQIEKYGHSLIEDEVIGNSVNILRLEVQVDYNLLRRICKKFKISKKHRNLEYLFDINIAKFVVEEKIENLFTCHDFYTYDKVKQILIENGYERNDKIFDYIYKVSHHQKTTSYKRYENILKSLNIYPYMFIPTKWKIEKLENPIKLLEEKIEIKQTYNLKLLEGGERVC